MNDFRIVQTRPLTHLLPYQVEEHRRVWYLPWPVWRLLRNRTKTPSAYRVSTKRFQTPKEARQCIEQRQASRAKRQAQQERQRDESRQRRQLPRVIEVMSAPLAA